MAEILFESVGKVYPGGTRAITDVDLHIDDGEFVVLVGPSGCGKSTLLRMLAGLEEITEGIVKIGDREVNDVPAKDRDIAMVFQNYALYPHMTVYNNMAYSLKLRKMNKDEIKERVDIAARTLEITDFLDRKPKALSGGQRQRVAMGRAIVREPAAFLMDEPLSNLDAKLRVQMRSELGELHKRLKTTTMYVTHDQVEAMTMGDRVAVIRKGVMQQTDTPRKLYDHPVNVFIGGFIGSPAMNFIYGRLESEGTRTYVTFGDTKLVVPRALLDSRPGLADYAQKQIVIGIRPEYFEHADAYSGVLDEDHTMTADVSLVEQLGSEALVHFSKPVPPVITPDIQELLADQGQGPDVLGDETKFTAKVNPRVDIASGDRIKLHVDTSILHFFDADSGDAIY
ncbi:MAG: sn-glycerol-3-phosphate ABC transporter ATP-binding protein UgpC [Acidimicrobiia bacterium]|nr:sn-glycerol-3-phosphate ABC transporter ATP-binding protein UgpC [Acidimicrobiia bacterium]